MRRDPNHLLYGLSEKEYSLKGVWLFALLFFGSLIAGAFLSLAAFKLTHYFDPDGSSYLASKPYPRFFDRARWVCVLILLPYLFVKCRLTSFAAIGFSRPFASVYVKWFGYGIAMIALVYGFNVAFGAFAIDYAWTAEDLAEDLAIALLGSFLIGSLEEIVFRGLVFRMFYTALNPLPAVLASSFFFAVLHFKTPQFSLGDLPPEQVGVSEALTIAGETAIAVFTQFDLKYLLAILLVGIVLHQVFLLTRNLWANIALHAGWVFTIKMFQEGFVTTDDANAFTGTTRIADGYWVSVALALFVALFAYLQARKPDPTRNAT